MADTRVAGTLPKLDIQIAFARDHEAKFRPNRRESCRCVDEKLEAFFSNEATGREDERCI